MWWRGVYRKNCPDICYSGSRQGCTGSSVTRNSSICCCNSWFIGINHQKHDPLPILNAHKCVTGLWLYLICIWRVTLCRIWALALPTVQFWIMKGSVCGEEEVCCRAKLERKGAAEWSKFYISFSTRPFFPPCVPDSELSLNTGCSLQPHAQKITSPSKYEDTIFRLRCWHETWSPPLSRFRTQRPNSSSQPLNKKGANFNKKSRTKEWGW